MNDSQVVEVIQSPPGLQCSQLMLSPKGLGTALVSVYDIGLAPPHAASALVMVLHPLLFQCDLFVVTGLQYVVNQDIFGIDPFLVQIVFSK